MVAYRYRAQKKSGEVIESVVYASSKEEAVEKIKETGCAQIEIGDIVSSETDDHRVYGRLNNSVYVHYKIFKKAKARKKEDIDYEPEIAGITKNMSAGGLLFNTSENLNIGTIIDLTLELKEEMPIQCLAKVVRIKEIVSNKEYDTAVYFLDLPNSERARLNRYIARGVEE